MPPKKSTAARKAARSPSAASPKKRSKKQPSERVAGRESESAPSPDEVPYANDVLMQKLSAILQSCQEESVPIGQSVARLRKQYDASLARNGGDDSEFFEKFVFLLRLPLIVKEKTSYVDRCIDVACKFATNFVDVAEKKHEESDTDDSSSQSVADLPSLLTKLFNWLLDHHEVESSSARLRICLMLNRLLKMLGEDAFINDDLFQKIYDNMLKRLKDKVAEIRSQAVTALQRLQDPRDPECPIVKAFLFHASMDPSAIVRRTVIHCIGATRHTLPHVLKRTRDIDETVRKASFKFIAQKIHIKSLTIAQREQLLLRGLSDRSEGVKSVVEKELVPTWLRLCNDNIVEMLYALDVGSSDGKIASDVLQVLFKNVPHRELVENFKFLDENKLVPFNKLTVETAVYWKCLSSFLFKEGERAQECLDLVLPELSKFCNYTRHFLLDLEKLPEDDVSWLFISKQLIEMTSVFDLSDEVGRANLGRLCKDLMSSKCIPASFIKSLMEVFATSKTSIDNRIQEVAEVIAELRDPLRDDDPRSEGMEEEPNKAILANNEEEQRKKQIEVAKIRVKLNILNNDLEEAVSSKDFLRAQEIKTEMNALSERQTELQAELAALSVPVTSPAVNAIRNRDVVNLGEEEDKEKEEDDPVIAHKCLEMIFQLLQDPNIKTLNATLQTLLEEFVLPSISHLNAEIRAAAVKAAGACCVRSIDAARQHLLLLFQIAHLDSLNVRMAALSAVNDLLIWHRLQSFITNGEDGAEDEPADIETILEMEKTNQRGLTQTDLNTQGGNSVVALLTRLLDDPEVDVRTKVTEGLCKLFMTGAINSPRLLHRLLLIWYNPLTESDEQLRHILGTFFPLYSSMSRENQISVADAMVPTLKTIINAPTSSPLSTIDFEDVGFFIIQLTREDFLQSKDNQGTNVHDEIALTLCNEVISDPCSFYNKSFIKFLLQLQISTNDFVVLRNLKRLHSEMEEIGLDKLCVRSLNRFGVHLTEWLKKDPLPFDPTENEVDGDEPRTSTQQVDQAMSDFSISSPATKRRMLFSQTNHTIIDN